MENIETWVIISILLSIASIIISYRVYRKSIITITEDKTVLLEEDPHNTLSQYHTNIFKEVPRCLERYSKVVLVETTKKVRNRIVDRKLEVKTYNPTTYESWY